MSEPQAEGLPSSIPELGDKASPSPTRTSPSPDAKDSELKFSRKREREVSLEPGTPTAGLDHDPIVRERKDSRTPLKNRRRLDPTEEEDDIGSGSRSGSGSPPTVPAVTSPRQAQKIRQISRGVEDITWKHLKKETPPLKDTDVEIKDSIPEEESMDGAALLAPPIEIEDSDIVHDNETPPRSPDATQFSQSLQDVRSTDAVMDSPRAGTQDAQLLSGLESQDKGLKRKFLERGTSQGPPENDEPQEQPTEPLKRARDEPDTDDNPRETKRPSPPPSPLQPSPPSPKLAKPSGFMAYASNSSPFAAVKGQNIFSSKFSASPSPFAPSPSPPVSLPEIAPTVSQVLATSAPTLVKRTGFDAFSSSSSPFAAAARMKSPTLGSSAKFGRAKSPPPRRSNASAPNPFASYAGSAHSFVVPAQKRARAGSPGSSRSSLERYPNANALGGSLNGSATGSGHGSDSAPEDDKEERTSTFGERLRAGKDEDEDIKSDDERSTKVQLTEQDVMTGEEDEETIHQVRGKLFLLNGTQWKEKGTGLLKLNVNRDDGTNARLVMRKDAVYTLLLNVTLFPGMSCTLAQDPRYLRFSAIDNGTLATYNLKVSNAKIAADLLEEINANIPT